MVSHGILDPFIQAASRSFPSFNRCIGSFRKTEAILTGSPAMRLRHFPANLGHDYSYAVDGIPRAGTRIDFADSVHVFTKEEALAWLNRNYPVGKQVTVYYDPRNPDLAV